MSNDWLIVFMFAMTVIGLYLHLTYRDGETK